MILDRKKNHRALGPDGFSLDHVQILRYDETTCRALANFMNLCVTEATIPDEWGRAFLFILYKRSGPKDNANNFRGIPSKVNFLNFWRAYFVRDYGSGQNLSNFSHVSS